MPSVAQTPSDFEQALLELLNRARLDPTGEYAALIDAAPDNVRNALSYFGVDLASFQAQLESLTAVAPLAWNSALASAATGHSELMISHDAQSHQLPGEASLGDRISAAGYDAWTRLNENIYAYAYDPVYAHAGFYIDWGYDDEDYSGSSLRSNWQSLGDGIQDPAGHRIAILNGELSEVGISVLQENNSATQVGPYVVTQNFGDRSDYQTQLLGVVIADGDGDRFYDIGEGLGGVTVTAVSGATLYSTTTWESGGYQMELPEGSYQVTFSGGGLEGVITQTLTMGAANHKLDGVAADAVTGYVALRGSAADDSLSGSLGLDQLLQGLAGADSLEGGSGSDNLLIGDSLQPCQMQDFADQVYRLYGATLDRAPDATGYLNWASRLFQGSWSLPEVAAGFINSAEFQSSYSNTSNSEFVTLLYNNVLDRGPDSAGLAAWSGALDSGTRSRAEVVLGFSNSAEYQQSTAAQAREFAQSNSPDIWADEVYRLYRATLDRDPDAGGFAGWMGQLGGGRDYLDVVQGFIGSEEFQATYGALDNGDFVELLYQNVLERSSDPAGLDNWTGRLDSGSSRAEVVRGFAQSAEFITDTAADLRSFVRGLGGGDRITLQGDSDQAAGGAYADDFLFSAAAGADHRILDFEAWDQLHLGGFGFADLTAALAAFEQQGQDVVFDAQDCQLTLVGIDLALLDEETVVLF